MKDDGKVIFKYNRFSKEGFLFAYGKLNIINLNDNHCCVTEEIQHDFEETLKESLTTPPVQSDSAKKSDDVVGSGSGLGGYGIWLI